MMPKSMRLRVIYVKLKFIYKNLLLHYGGQYWNKKLTIYKKFSLFVVIIQISTVSNLV